MSTMDSIGREGIPLDTHKKQNEILDINFVLWEQDGDKEKKAFLLEESDQDIKEKKDVIIDMKPPVSDGNKEEKKELDDNKDNEDDDWDKDDDDDGKGGNILSKFVIFIQTAFKMAAAWLSKVTGGYFKSVFLLLAYAAYVIGAILYKPEGEAFWRLIACTCFGVFLALRFRLAFLLKTSFVKIYGSDKLTIRARGRIEIFRFYFRWFMYAAMAALMFYTLYSEARESVTKLRSIPGLIIVMFICLLFSTNPKKINWHTIYVSIALQFLFALTFLKWSLGRDALIWIQARLGEFFDNSKAGSIFLFGENYADHYVAFGAFPIILIMGSVMAVLYQTGAMQLIIKSIGTFLYFLLDTDPIESTCVAAGIFVEGVIAIMSLQPFLANMTRSELFVVMTSALSSLGGAYMGILISLTVPLEFLLPAMMISAPATFTVCKLMYPETQKRNSGDNKIDFEIEKSNGILESLQNGAVSMIPLMANVLAIVFVFMSCISWVDNTIAWFGERVGLEGFTMTFIFSYLLYPVSLAMGIEGPDCRAVATLWGYRLTSSNIIAFFKLIEMRENRVLYNRYVETTNNTGTITCRGDQMILEQWNKTLTGGMISIRSEAIVTYSLCGFSSILSVGITLGVFYTLLPKRRQWLSTIPLQALVAGNIANLMSGCFASFFY